MSHDLDVFYGSQDFVCYCNSSICSLHQFRLGLADYANQVLRDYCESYRDQKTEYGS